MKNLKIYISIPISGKDYRKQREHADEVAASLSKQGYQAVNPFNIYAGKNPSYEDHLTADLRILMDCDAVYFCHGWEHSFGCCVEHDYVMRACAFNKKTYVIHYESPELYD